MFDIGQRVMSRSSPPWRGEVRFAHPVRGGHPYYDVRRDDGGEQTVSGYDLREEVLAGSAWDLVAANVFGDYAEFAVATAVHKVQNASNNTVSTLRASRTLFKPYQYKPLVKFLESDARRILVADEVGLGKTIEAGHILLEMSGRKELRNALVVCPKSLQDNWAAELRDRFHFSFKVYDSAKDLAADVRRDHADGRRGLLGVVNYEKCKSDHVLAALEETGYLFDLVVCDESHRLRNRGTQLYGAMERMLRQASAALFLTGTPIMLGEEDLFSQIRLLDEGRFPNLEVFQNALALNRPFVRALSALNAGAPMADVARDLTSAEVRTTVSIGEEFRFEERSTVGETLANDPLYARAVGRMTTAPEDPEEARAVRARVQSDLADLNSLSHLYTRTRKREVDTVNSRTERDARRLRVSLSPEERELYDAVADSFGGLEVVQKKRMIASSIVAYHGTREDLEAGRYPAGIPDAKFDRFRAVIDEVVGRRGKKAIVFSTFRNTLLYLRAKLAELGVRTAVLHGGIDDRGSVVDAFADAAGPMVLLSSEVGREGLNLQFADTVVNYDLPWNPMAVEQRIGRVDRIGQTSPVIHVYSFTVTGTIEERIYDRLLDRIGVFRSALGDLEDILGEDDGAGALIGGLERDLYRDALTPEEQDRRIDEVALAIEAQRVDLERIEERLTDAVVNDAHFRNEIDRIVSDRRYLTGGEVRGLVEGLFRAALKPFSVADVDGACEVRTTSRDVGELVAFVEAHKDSTADNPELDVLFRAFKRDHLGKARIRVTFDQEAAYDDRSLEYVHAYHPVVNAAANYFTVSGLHLNKAYRLGLDRAHLAEAGVGPGDYLLAVYRVVLEKETPYGDRRAEYLLAALADLNDDVFVLLPEEVAGRVFGEAQVHAVALPDPVDFDADLVRSVRSPVALSVMEMQEHMRTDEGVRLASSALRRRGQLRQYFESQIQRRKELLAGGRGIRQILESELADLGRQLSQVEAGPSAPEVRASNDVVSVNHLQVL